MTSSLVPLHVPLCTCPRWPTATAEIRPLCGHVMGCPQGEWLSARAEIERLRLGLERIHGHFVRGERNTYAPADVTLDMIRAEAAEALGLSAPTDDEVPS